MENTHNFHQVAISSFTNDRLKSIMLLSTRMHRLSHGIDNISPNTGSSMLGEDDGKILRTSSIILLHAQTLNHPGMILNEVNSYCTIASGLVVDMQASCIPADTDVFRTSSGHLKKVTMYDDQTRRLRNVWQKTSDLRSLVDVRFTSS